jgi:hypothetical protein
MQAIIIFSRTYPILCILIVKLYKKTSNHTIIYISSWLAAGPFAWNCTLNTPTLKRFIPSSISEWQELSPKPKQVMTPQLIFAHTEHHK